MISFPLLEQQGRLGNQLWQIAGTIGIANKLNERIALPPNWSYRSFFSIPDELFSENFAMCVDAGKVPNHIDSRCRAYLQDYSLWSDCESVVREYFKPSALAKKTLKEVLSSTGFSSLPQPILSVHVRRGDNVPGADPGCEDKHLWHPLRPLSYYLDAISYHSGKYKSVAVFSDDIKWCKENIPANWFYEGVTRPPWDDKDFKFSPVLDWIDLFLMNKCDHHVISNSSYAWWGAFLSKNNSPVYPSPWYGPNLSYVNARAMFPYNWKMIEHEVYQQ